MHSSPSWCLGFWKQVYLDEQQSATTWTSNFPVSSRSTVVWKMQAWVSIPHKMTESRERLSSSNINSGTPHMEKQVLENGTTPNLSSSNSGTVFPRPFGYCSVASIGMSRIFAASIILREFETISGKKEMFGRNFSCMSQSNSETFWGLQTKIFILEINSSFKLKGCNKLLSI